MAAGAVGEIIGFAKDVMNNAWADARTQKDRKENFLLNEASAIRSDLRARALYKDFYSPEALLKQYEVAGLSPSMMYGGTPGQGALHGAQGAGSSGLQTPFMPFSLVEAAQAAALFSEANKNKAQTKNIDQDTVMKELQTALMEMTNTTYKTEFELMNSRWTDEDTGKPTSMFEMARDCYTYETFLEKIRKGLEHENAQGLLDLTGTENGQKTLKAIYMGANRFHRDIMVLSEESVSADFQRQLISAMESKGFIDMNADSAIAYLKANIQTSELQETQKEAWNNLISKLGQKGSTTRDIVIVLGMILNNVASNWKFPKFNRE